MSVKRPFLLKQSVFGKIFSLFTNCYDSVCNFIFYLPCGGEASFRKKCVRSAGFKDGDRVLDLCCGTGEFAGAIENEGFSLNLVGIDISKRAIQTAKTKAWHMPITFLKANANDLPFESNRFDKCIISFGLHHMTKHDRRNTLLEIERTLSPEGALLIIDYNSPNNKIRRMFAEIMAKLDQSKEAYEMVKKGSLIGEIKEAGFIIEKRLSLCLGLIQLLKAVKKQHLF
jgi:demethylmenaquinone methyltransferase/2-methoxy-6-polyprenyl-1,4-benzoquinol methylase